MTGKRTGSLSRVRLALLGLTFKAGTDDLRDSPALAIAALLRQAGADLVAFDPAFVEGPEAMKFRDGVPAPSEIEGVPLARGRARRRRRARRRCWCSPSGR